MENKRKWIEQICMQRTKDAMYIAHPLAMVVPASPDAARRSAGGFWVECHCTLYFNVPPPRAVGVELSRAISPSGLPVFHQARIQYWHLSI